MNYTDIYAHSFRDYRNQYVSIGLRGSFNFRRIK